MTIHDDIERRTLNNRYELRNRYVFEGQLVMQTALHIGGGKATLSSSNSPIVLTPEQNPFIPGSSFKGALRSTVEKIVPGLPATAKFSSCAFIELSEEQAEIYRRNSPSKWPEGVCPTIWQSELSRRKREEPGQAEALSEEALKSLCDTCLLFGSPFTAARLSISDLYLAERSSVIERRDGVAIDRDSEKARDRLKYDFEVVPASATFNLRIVLENATERDVQLLCIGLSEFVHGFGVIGGKRSRGLGVSALENLQVSALELEGEDITPEKRNQRLREYLIHGTLAHVPGDEFLQTHIERLFAEPGR